MQVVPGVEQKTVYVSGDEPCYLIAEINMPVPVSGEGLHRFRFIYVSRGDELAEYREDLGRATAHPNNTFLETQVRTGGVEAGKGWSEHTVAEAIELIEYGREPRFDINDVPRLGDLEEGYQSAIEQRKRPQNRTVFGHGD